jgi:hypothetical protein
MDTYSMVVKIVMTAGIVVLVLLVVLYLAR